MNTAVSIGALAVAIIAEVVATTALKATDGMTRLGPMMLVVTGYAVAFALLAVSLERFPLAFVYSVWAGFGMVGAALCGWWLFDEPLSLSAGVGIALITAGVFVLARTMGNAAA